jgi:uroporphyrinogen decarboxylase
MKAKASAGSLSRRERFIKTLNHQEPDRVPIDLGSAGGGITDVAYNGVREYLGIKGGEGTTYTTTLVVSNIDERVLQALNVDIRHLGLRGPKRRPGRVEQGDGSWADEWGIVYRKAGYYNQIVGNPLRNATLADLVHYPWPDASDPAIVEGLAQQARNLYEGTEFGLSAKSVSGGIFQTCCRLRSMEQFLMDMLLDKPFAKGLLARVEETVLSLTDALLSAVSAGGELDTGGTATEEKAAAPESQKALSLYDFRRPDRVSKDQMRTLQNLHDSYVPADVN